MIGDINILMHKLLSWIVQNRMRKKDIYTKTEEGELKDVLQEMWKRDTKRMG